MHTKAISHSLLATLFETSPVGVEFAYSPLPRSLSCLPSTNPYQRIYDTVNEIFSKGSSNIGLDEEVATTLDFYREIIAQYSSFGATDYFFYTSEECGQTSLINVALDALFAKCYRCGNCYEHASAVVMETLIHHSSEFKSIDIIGLEGTIDPPNGIPIRDTHRVVIYNRPPTADLNAPERWVGAYGIDTWSKQSFQSPLTTTQLMGASRLRPKVNIMSEYRRDKPLTSVECERILGHLVSLKAYLTTERLVEIMKIYFDLPTLADAEQERDKIHYHIDLDIQLYKEVKNQHIISINALESKTHRTTVEKNLFNVSTLSGVTSTLFAEIVEPSVNASSTHSRKIGKS